VAWKRSTQALLRTTTTKALPRSLHRKARTKEQSQRRVQSLILIMVYNDRGVYKDRHARISSWPGETFSNQRPNTFAQTCLLDQPNPCSRAADHTLWGLIIKSGILPFAALISMDFFATGAMV
jgi:hypothetical protein